MGTTISVSPYPNVPNVPGVPSLLRQVGAATATAQPLIADAEIALGQFSSQWGLYDQNGELVLTADSVVGFDFRQEYRVADYPVEEGGFASYNKVQTPFSVRLTFTKAGSDTDRASFLAQVAGVCASLELFVAVTPEVAYPNVNAVRYDFRRTAQNGVKLLTVDLLCEEIRIAPDPAFAQTKQPDGADPVSVGNVAPQPMGTAQSANLPQPAGTAPAPASTTPQTQNGISGGTTGPTGNTNTDPFTPLYGPNGEWQGDSGKGYEHYGDGAGPVIHMD